MKKIMLLGSGELGRELVISLKRLGCFVIACDKYAKAPAMQVADTFEVFEMTDAKSLKAVVRKHKPDFIVPEVEAIQTETLLGLEKAGTKVIPTARATHLTMNRDAIRDLAGEKLKLKTAKYYYAESEAEMLEKIDQVGYPCVIKPVMSSSGKGQSVAKNIKDLKKSWKLALDGMRGQTKRVIVEEFISFESEITLLTVKQKKGPTLFVDPIGHRQERGDYQESWIPAKVSSPLLSKAKRMAKKVTDELGGSGLFGVEFFLTKNEVYFSELSPRPHDTGMVTLISQNLSEFDLHARAILGLPIPKIEYYGPSASSVILASKASKKFTFTGVDKALDAKNVDVRLFCKPTTRPYRRMGVSLARSTSEKRARVLANTAAAKVKIRYTS